MRGRERKTKILVRFFPCRSLMKLSRRNPLATPLQPLDRVRSISFPKKKKAHKHLSSPSLGIPSSDSKPLSARLRDFRHE